jgi:hypothetical protein
VTLTFCFCEIRQTIGESLHSRGAKPSRGVSSMIVPKGDGPTLALPLGRRCRTPGDVSNGIGLLNEPLPAEKYDPQPRGVGVSSAEPSICGVI